jgi:hypothetical protein
LASLNLNFYQTYKFYNSGKTKKNCFLPRHSLLVGDKHCLFTFSIDASIKRSSIKVKQQNLNKQKETNKE